MTEEERDCLTREDKKFGLQSLAIEVLKKYMRTIYKYIKGINTGEL